MERKRRETSGNYTENLSVSIWEQDAGSSSLPTRTKNPSNSFDFGGFFFSVNLFYFTETDSVPGDQF